MQKSFVAMFLATSLAGCGSNAPTATTNQPTASTPIATTTNTPSPTAPSTPVIANPSTPSQAEEFVPPTLTPNPTDAVYATATILSQGPSSYAIAADEDNVYFQQYSNSDGYSITKISRAGGELTTIASSAEQILAMTAYKGDIFWTTETTLYRNHAGTTTTLATNLSEPWSITTDGEFVFFAFRGTYEKIFVDGTISKVEIATGIVSTVLAPTQSPGSLTRAGANVYFVGMDPQLPNGGIFSVPVDGGEPTLIGAPSKPLHGFGVDATQIYWTQSDATEIGEVMSAPMAGGDSVALVGNLEYPDALYVGASKLYWTGYVNKAETANAVQTAPISGGTADTVSATQGIIFATLAAGNNLYWISSEGVVSVITQ